MYNVGSFTRDEVDNPGQDMLVANSQAIHLLYSQIARLRLKTHAGILSALANDDDIMSSPCQFFRYRSDVSGRTGSIWFIEPLLNKTNLHGYPIDY